MTKCIPKTDWIGFVAGATLFAFGATLTLTVIGAIIGIPIVLLSLELMTNPKTLRGTPCAA